MTFFSVVKGLREWHVWLFQSECLLCDTFDECIKHPCADNVLEELKYYLTIKKGCIMIVWVYMCLTHVYSCVYTWNPNLLKLLPWLATSDLIKTALFINMPLGKAVK